MTALVCDQNEKELAELLSALDEVQVFPDGVALAYYLQRNNPCSLAVIAVEGATGMNACTYTKRNRETMPVLWITEQQDFFNQSRRIPVDGFLVKPVTLQEISENAQMLLRSEVTKTGERLLL